MIRFYSNRELSEKLAIKLSKWKRWSREFLPPDPLGGQQSGYARQYPLDQAFTVFLGGHLGADLHFSIAEAKKILDDLNVWTASFTSAWPGTATGARGKDTCVFIFRQLSAVSGEVTFAYVERNSLVDEPYAMGGVSARHEVYRETPIAASDYGHAAKNFSDLNKMNARILYASRLFERFTSVLVRLGKQHAGHRGR